MQLREQAVSTSKIREQVEEFSILCRGRCKPLGSLNSFLSYAPQLSGAKPVSLLTSQEWWDDCFLPSPSSSAITLGGGSICGSQFGVLSFTFGSQKSLNAMTLLVYYTAEMFSFHTALGYLHTEGPAVFLSLFFQTLKVIALTHWIHCDV